MTSFFAYDELTWPEVAALRRDTPLVIPLGEGYDLAQLAEALGDPPAVGLLPPIPYGWPGSGLATAAAPFAHMVSNLLGSLQDDRFSRGYALHPHGLVRRRDAVEGAGVAAGPDPGHVGQRGAGRVVAGVEPRL